MPYQPDSFRLPKFYRYIVRVFDFGDTVKAMTDSRKNPKVPIGTLFRAFFLCVLLRFGSKRSITKESKAPQFRKFLRRDVSFCDNTVGHGLEHIGIASLEEELTRTPKQLKRNKAFRDTIGGLHVVALDGSEFYRSTSIHCNLYFSWCTPEKYEVMNVFATVLTPRMALSSTTFINWS